jgi:hypothetical protein
VTAISPRYGIGGQVLGTLNATPKKNERANVINIRISGFDPVREETTTHFSRFIIESATLLPDEEGYILIGANLIKKIFFVCRCKHSRTRPPHEC